MTGTGLVVAMYDRLTRSLLDFLVLYKWLQERGKTLIWIDPPQDFSTPFGNAMANVLITFAERRWAQESISCVSRVENRCGSAKLVRVTGVGGGVVPWIVIPCPGSVLLLVLGMCELAYRDCVGFSAILPDGMPEETPRLPEVYFASDETVAKAAAQPVGRAAVEWPERAAPVRPVPGKVVEQRFDPRVLEVARRLSGGDLGRLVFREGGVVYVANSRRHAAYIRGSPGYGGHGKS